jgi:hypothetical protein
MRASYSVNEEIGYETFDRSCNGSERARNAYRV